MVDVGGREDETEELEWDGDAQLEPAPENCFWQVAGSHQAGPVSHWRKGEFRHGRSCVWIHEMALGSLPIQLRYLRRDGRQQALRRISTGERSESAYSMSPEHTFDSHTEDRSFAHMTWMRSKELLGLLNACCRARDARCFGMTGQE